MKKNIKLSDSNKALLIRMWMAGIVSFFIAWTPIGGGAAEHDGFLIQLILMLSLGLFFANIVIVNPIIRGMFKTKLDASVYFNQNIFLRSAKHIGNLTKMFLITMLIWSSYIIFNLAIEALGYSNSTGRPFLMLEPITFGLLYGLYYYIFEIIIYKLFYKKIPKENREK